MTKRILITGASGFIGSHVARELSSRGHQVAALTRQPGAADVPWSWASWDVLDQTTEAFDAIVHVAAIRHRHGIAPESYLTENTTLTKRLLEFAQRTKSGRFVLVSSIAVFGWPKQLPISDKNPYAPVGPYGESKIGCEKKTRESGHPYAIVRPSITYGPDDTNGMIDKLFRLVAQEKYRVIGSGRTRCQLVYVKDLAYAIAETALRDGLDGVEFTCTYRDPIAMKDLSHLCADILHRKHPALGVPLLVARCAATAFEILEKLHVIKGEPLVTHEKLATVTVDRAYDISRMREVLGWEPQTGYREGLTATAAAMGLLPSSSQ